MALDEKDIERINELIGTGLTAFVASDAFTQALGAGVGEAVKGLNLDEANKKLAEELEALKAAGKGGAGNGGDGGGDGGGKGGDGGEETEALKKMRKRIEDAEAKVRAAEQRAAEEKQKARSNKLTSAARAALIDAGVPANRIKHAMAFIGTEGLLAYGSDDEDAAPGFHGENSYGQKVILPMAEGVKKWMKSDDAKAFLPASEAQGDGKGNGGRANGGGGKTASAASIVGAALAARA